MIEEPLRRGAVLDVGGATGEYGPSPERNGRPGYLDMETEVLNDLFVCIFTSKCLSHRGQKQELGR